MPELPEVKTVINHLKTKIINWTVTDIFINKEKLIKEIEPSNFKKMLINRTINSLENVGKFIVFKFDHDLVLLSHLRMEGKYRLENDLLHLNAHDHLIFKIKNEQEKSEKYLIYNDTRQFGTFHLRTNDNYLTLLPLKKIAPEPALVNIDKIYKKLQSKKIAIKTALLDQTLIAGLGNIYVNEVLWTVKINPDKTANSLSFEQVEEIIKVADTILKQATKLGGTTIKSFLAFDKTAGNFQKFLNVHNKTGEPCKRCFALIAKKLVNQRGTYYCAVCQN